VFPPGAALVLLPVSPPVPPPPELLHAAADVAARLTARATVSIDRARTSPPGIE
jgi:hypothetical protein